MSRRVSKRVCQPHELLCVETSPPLSGFVSSGRSIFRRSESRENEMRSWQTGHSRPGGKRKDKDKNDKTEGEEEDEEVGGMARSGIEGGQSSASSRRY